MASPVDDKACPRPPASSPSSTSSSTSSDAISTTDLTYAPRSPVTLTVHSLSYTFHNSSWFNKPPSSAINTPVPAGSTSPLEDDDDDATSHLRSPSTTSTPLETPPADPEPSRDGRDSPAAFLDPFDSSPRQTGSSFKLLRNVNLIARPGEVTAIVGPSGSGKTTLLNMLAMRAKTSSRINCLGFGRIDTTGKILYNGKRESTESIKSIVNYVMSSDKQLAYLTVYETLQVAARLKLKRSSKAARRQRIERIINEVGLQGCRDIPVGGEWKKGISTGEMRRLSIAIELLDDPSLLLLDEPTSGLDSALALDLVRLLVDVARAGRTVLCTIHQPRTQVFDLFDQAVLLGEGRILYHGPAASASSYFASIGYPCPPGYNIADFLVELVAPKTSRGCGVQLDASALAARQRSESLNGEVDNVDTYGAKAFPATFCTAASHGAEPPDIVCSSATASATSEDGGQNLKFRGKSINDNDKATPLQIGVSHAGGIHTAGKAVVVPSPGSTLLAEAFERSPEYFELISSINSATAASVATKDSKPRTPKNCCGTCYQAIGDWFVEVRYLAKRSFLNSIRNPMVCFVMFLIQMLQGVFLGGIFFQLSAQVRDIPPPTTFLPFDISYRQVYDFVSDMMPLMLLGEWGADGKGSHPIASLAFQPGLRNWVHTTLNCTYDSLNLSDQYPNFYNHDDPAIPIFPPTTTTTTPSNRAGLPKGARAVRGNPSPYESLTRYLSTNDPNGGSVGVRGLASDMGLTSLSDSDVGAIVERVRQEWPSVTLPDGDDATGRGLTLSQTSGVDTNFGTRQAVAPPGAIPQPPTFEESVVDIVHLIQIIDYSVYHVHIKKCFEGVVLTDCMKDPEVQRFFLKVWPCLDFSKGPSVLRRLKAVMEPEEHGGIASFNISSSFEGSNLLSGVIRLLGIEDSLESSSLAAANLRMRRLQGHEGKVQDMMKTFNGEDLAAAYDMVMRSIDNCNTFTCLGLKAVVDGIAQWGHDFLITVTSALNVSGCLFFAVAYLGLSSYDALLTFPQERALFNRETATGLYGPSSYFVGKNVADLPFQVGPALALVTIYYWLVGLNPSPTSFFTYFAFCGLVSFAAYGFGYMVSAGCSRMEVAVLIAPMLLVLSLVLAGFFLRDPDIPSWINWFKYLSIYRWGFFGLVSNEFPSGGFFGVLPNDIILVMAGITNNNLATHAAWLTGLAFSFRVTGYILLTLTNRRVGLEV